MSGLSRKEFLASAAALAAGGILAPQGEGKRQTDEITVEDLKAAERLFGLEFTDDERKAVLSSVRSASRSYESLRNLSLSYQVEPSTPFRPLAAPEAFVPRVAAEATSTKAADKPAKAEDLAHTSIREQGNLIRTKQISPVELTRMYLDRLERYGEKLLNVVTITRERALKAAATAEDEIVAGRYRGPLHGIPYGLKDLFATKSDLTTWGSEPHKDQRFDFDAAVVERLEEAGAILVAKTSLGALAMGDVWFRGRTKNPWNPERGSSGSSAGSASCTAAGLVGFSIGTETLGSIVSPSHECRVTGLRPTYGRVSRYGGMAVSWTMDKVGPICREVEDCALVLAAICGYDARDPSTVSRSFVWPGDIDIRKLKIGYLLGPNDDPEDRSRLEGDGFLKTLAGLGANLQPVKFDPLLPGVNMILGVEAAAAFDDFTRSDRDDLLKNSTWPTFYRQHRYIPAVEYLQAQRARTMAMRRFEEQFGDLDLFVANERGGHTLFITNYTGHPQILVPDGTDERGNGRSVSFVGRLYREDVLAAVAKAYQDATGHHLKHPADSNYR